MLNQDLYDTTPGMIHRATNVAGMDESSVMLAGELAEGLVGPRNIASWAMPEVEGVAVAAAAFDRHNRKPQERVLTYLGSLSAVYTIRHCVSNAVDEVGWDKLDGAALRDQFLKLDDFSPLGGIQRLTYTADKPEPTQTRIFQVQDGKLLPITDWVICPDLRPAQYK